ncbi:MAG: SoxR reducing system RseC family protein [Treponema sp.]|nr:SoxR reducing system RseC family protein [Treponema sp.]
MTATYFVVDVRDETVRVIPDIEGACLTCQGHCTERTTGIVVENTRHIPVQPGDKVKIGSRSPWDVAKNILALAVPFVCAVLGYRLAHRMLRTPQDSILAASAFICLAVGALIVYVAARIRPSTRYLEITARIP